MLLNTKWGSGCAAAIFLLAGNCHTVEVPSGTSRTASARISTTKFRLIRLQGKREAFFVHIFVIISACVRYISYRAHGRLQSVLSRGLKCKPDVSIKLSLVKLQQSTFDTVTQSSARQLNTTSWLD